MKTFEMLESNVRSYCRSFPVVFDKAKGDQLYADTGEAYIDFLLAPGRSTTGITMSL